MTELNLFPPEATQIKCNTPSGDSILIDAVELESISHSLFSNSEEALPYDEYMVKMRDAFAVKYGFTMGIASMQQLIRIKDELLANIKKNITT